MIQTVQLHYQYSVGPALVFPDVNLAQGAVLLLTGPSGCGKSTWLALVAGLMAPTSGTLTVAGQALDGLKPRATDAWRAQAIGFLPQKLHLSAALTVAQNMSLVLWACGLPDDPARIATALRALDVQDLAQRYPAQLSGGQAQRVALARAVLLQPRVILADEPTASLDDAAAADAVGLLLSTARTHGATLVIATHDARVNAYLAASNPGPTGIQSLRLAQRSALKDTV